MIQKNYKIEVLELIKNNPEISTGMIVFKSKTLNNEDQFEKNKRVRSAIFRCAKDRKIKKISLCPARWVLCFDKQT